MIPIFVILYFFIIRLIITGTTGMVGKGALIEALADPAITQVLSLSRKPIGISHPKLKELLEPEFFNLAPLQPELARYDACLHCLGISAAGLREDQYTRITEELTLHLAQTLLRLNPQTSLCYVSGQGTDSTNTSRQMWARVKGHTENALLAMPFRHVHMFRPGFIQSLPGVQSATRLYNVLYNILWPLYRLFRLLPSIANTSQKLSRAMIRAAQAGYAEPILENRNINELGA